MTRPGGWWIKGGLALLGLGLLATVLARIDLGQVAGLVGQAGWGLLLVFGVAVLAFTADAASWHAVLPGLAIDVRDFIRLWSVRLVGEALNTVTPLAGVGGEPLKALLLVRNLGLEPGAAIASVIVAKTTILLSYIPFLAVGFILLLGFAPARAVIVVAGAGLVLYTTAIVGFFLVQRYGLASRVAARVHAYPWAAGLEAALHQIRGVDRELERLYVDAPLRLWASLALAFVGWLLGAGELYVISAVLGFPLSAWDIWAAEAVVQLLRQATGFIPGSLGVTEAALALLYGVLLGNPSVGVAVALVRRLREVVWIAGGVVVGIATPGSRPDAGWRP